MNFFLHEQKLPSQLVPALIFHQIRPRTNRFGQDAIPALAL